ncbi:TatD family hydrolase [Pseudoalteromonas fenneropenaei]|uniref:TatD family hydrolase n=1 Tax=Pseudoalteromonas fenneropenaei TaxID=1737459 RepID=A0ABV7CNT1_9GAMM
MLAHWVDCGVNLTSSQFAEQTAAVVTRAKAANVQQLLLIGCDVAGSNQAAELAKTHQLVATAGVHPHDAKSVSANYLQHLSQLLSRPEVVAVGECGLDFNRDFSPRDQQEKVLREQLALAQSLQLPVYLHERDASETMLKVLQDYRVHGVLHCFTGNHSALMGYLDYGLHIGITGWICDERRGDKLRTLLPEIPLERLLLETDAPYLLPRTLRPKPKSGKNEPAYLPEIASQVATLLGTDLAHLQQQTSANFYRLFMSQSHV